MKRDQRYEPAGAVDMALDDVASERRSGGRGKLEVDDGIGTQVSQSGAGDGLGGQVRGEARWKRVGLNAEGGQTDAIDRDAVARVQARGKCGRGDGDARRARGGGNAEQRAGGFDEAGKHKYRVSRTGIRKQRLRLWASAMGRGGSR